MNNSENFKRPEALRLADYFDYHGFFDSDRKAASELRRLHQEVEGLSSENIRLQNLVKDLSDWNDSLKERLSYREAYPDNFLKEPEQEPVAVVSGYYGGQCVILPIDPARIFNSNTALYTSPQAQRTWVELSDEEIEKGREHTFSTNNPYCPCDRKTMRKAVRWAEFALRKKNGIN